MAKHIGITIRNATLRQRVAERVRGAGGRVSEGDLGMEAFNAAQGGEVDALVLDMHLSDMHGDQICRDLKSMPESMGLPVLMLIEEEDDWFRERCEEAGADVVLTYQEAPKIVTTLGKLIKADVRVNTPGRLDYYLVESSSRDTFRGRVRDVSISGLAFVSDRSELEPGFLIDCKLMLPESEGPYMGRAEVIRVEPKGADGFYRVHLAWRGFRKGDQGRLKAWIRSRAPNA